MLSVKNLSALFFAVFAFILTSCLKESAEPANEGLVIVDKYSTTKSFEVPVANDGSVTQVIYHRADGEQEILATTDVPLTIQIPAWIEPEVRSGDTGEEYIEIRRYALGLPGFEANSWIKDGNSVLMFEDSRGGDFDYNDLVLYVNHSIKGNNITTQATITISVKPIALGGMHHIAFGWEDGNGEHILSNNVREDYFGGRQGIINAYMHLPFVEPIAVGEGCGNERHSGYTIVKDRALMTRDRSADPGLDEVVGGYIVYDPVPTTCSTQSNDAKKIKWFIKSTGNKYYVSSIDKAAPAGTFPYGISIPNGAYHAREAVPFAEVYPGFEPWIKTGTPINWGTSNINRAKIYDKHPNYARW